MIASLHGILELISSDWAVINVNGIGFRVYMPTSTMSTLGSTGKEIHLHTHLVLREDSATVYGFSSGEELDLFQILISVSGMGARLALAALSTMSVEQLSMAIASGNAELLTVIPGVGKKMASRIVLELKDKISAGLLAAPAAQLTEENSDVLTALISLGYSVSEATRAIAALPSTPVISLEEKIKLALQHFGSK